MDTAKLGKRGTLVIPAKLRHRFALKEGDLLVTEEREDGILLRPAVAVPVEIYTPERKAEFFLNNAVSPKTTTTKPVRHIREDFGLDPAKIPNTEDVNRDDLPTEPRSLATDEAESARISQVAGPSGRAPCLNYSASSLTRMSFSPPPIAPGHPFLQFWREPSVVCMTSFYAADEVRRNCVRDDHTKAVRSLLEKTHLVSDATAFQPAAHVCAPAQRSDPSWPRQFRPAPIS